MSYKASEELCIYSVLKTCCALCLLVGLKGTDPSLNPTNEADQEGKLGSVAWMDKYGIIGGPGRSSKLDHLLLTKELLFIYSFSQSGFL